MRRHYPKRIRPILNRWYSAELDDGAAPPVSQELWQQGANAKAVKTQAHIGEDFLIFTHTMLSGDPAVCSHASPGCLSACVVSQAGMVKVFPQIREGRARLNRAYKANPERYLQQLADQHVSIVDRYHCFGLWRGNTGQDIPLAPAITIANREIERRGLPRQIWYDYTAVKEYALDPTRPANYHLCFSRKENNSADCWEVLTAGGIVAVVFHQVGNYANHGAYKQRLPETWKVFGKEYPVYDGDQHDIRIPGLFDPPRPDNGEGYIVGLRLKGDYRGRQKAIETGFSLEVAS